MATTNNGTSNKTRKVLLATLVPCLVVTACAVGAFVFYLVRRSKRRRLASSSSSICTEQGGVESKPGCVSSPPCTTPRLSIASELTTPSLHCKEKWWKQKLTHIIPSSPRPSPIWAQFMRLNSSNTSAIAPIFLDPTINASRGSVYDLAGTLLSNNRESTLVGSGMRTPNRPSLLPLFETSGGSSLFDLSSFVKSLRAMRSKDSLAPSTTSTNCTTSTTTTSRDDDHLYYYNHHHHHADCRPASPTVATTFNTVPSPSCFSCPAATTASNTNSSSTSIYSTAVITAIINGPLLPDAQNTNNGSVNNIATGADIDVPRQTAPVATTASLIPPVATTAAATAAAAVIAAATQASRPGSVTPLPCRSDEDITTSSITPSKQEPRSVSGPASSSISCSPLSSLNSSPGDSSGYLRLSAHGTAPHRTSIGGASWVFLSPNICEPRDSMEFDTRTSPHANAIAQTHRVIPQRRSVDQQLSRLAVQQQQQQQASTRQPQRRIVSGSSIAPSQLSRSSRGGGAAPGRPASIASRPTRSDSDNSSFQPDRARGSRARSWSRCMSLVSAASMVSLISAAAASEQGMGSGGQERRISLYSGTSGVRPGRHRSDSVFSQRSEASLWIPKSEPATKKQVKNDFAQKRMAILSRVHRVISLHHSREVYGLPPRVTRERKSRMPMRYRCHFCAFMGGQDPSVLIASY